MGCTSSKTKSVEDLTGVGTKKQAPTNQPKEKNGTAKNNSEQPILRETAKTTNATAPSSSEAIQIPGAHRSFLAPDGIPFIDEDVDDDDDHTGDTVTSPRPDVNKNLAKEPEKQPAKPPVVVEVKSPTVSVTTEEERRPAKEEAAPVAVPVAASVAEPQAPEEPTVQEPQPDVDKAWSEALDVLNKDLELDAAPASSTEHETVHLSATVAADTAASAPDQVISEDQQAAAAVKIQAGIRGYRDRQKVKAIRAAQHVPTDELESSAVAHQPEVIVDAPVVSVSVDQSVPDVTVEVNHQSVVGDEVHNDVAVSNQEESAATVVVEDPNLSSGELAEDSDDDPDKQRAAVKIQANYKGWKTRKEIGKGKP